ncbi:MAG: hypothetical protein BGN83_10215 [Rhizobium sp. 63-7]|nr:MAG: hypothetical protein BGN83_10215 [Rhizobium sp. 63-7]
MPEEREPLITPHHILVLEDSLIIAMEAEDIFRGLGASEIYVASNLREAKELIDVHPIDFALLDVNLGSTMSFDFARALREKGVPFGFSSGYPDNTDFPDDLKSVSLLRKPFGEETILQHLADVFGKHG